MKKLIILRGIPGAGKTTFAQFLASSLDLDTDVAICAADDYFYEEDGTYNYDGSQAHNAHLSCQQNVEIAMQRGFSAFRDWVNGDRQHEPKSVVIVHNTTTTPKELKTYTDLATQYGYEVTSLIVENRHGNRSVHNVPDETLGRMIKRFDVKLV
jgi:predicted kinase